MYTLAHCITCLILMRTECVCALCAHELEVRDDQPRIDRCWGEQ